MIMEFSILIALAAICIAMVGNIQLQCKCKLLERRLRGISEFRDFDTNDRVFIICIGLSNKSDVGNFEEVLSSIGSDVKKIMENVYAVKTSYTNTSEILRNQITAKFNGQCTLFIMKSSIDAAWRVPVDVDNWMKNYI